MHNGTVLWFFSKAAGLSTYLSCCFQMLQGVNELKEKLFIKYKGAVESKYFKNHPHSFIDRCRVIYWLSCFFIHIKMWFSLLLLVAVFLIEVNYLYFRHESIFAACLPQVLSCILLIQTPKHQRIDVAPQRCLFLVQLSLHCFIWMSLPSVCASLLSPVHHSAHATTRAKGVSRSGN